MDDDPTGPWTPHPERERVIDSHCALVWTLLGAFRLRAASDAIFRRELDRMLDQAAWAATETKVGDKYDLRFVSEGVVRVCRVHGPLRRWSKLRKEVRPAALNHEHVTSRATVKRELYAATSQQMVRDVLAAAVGCVVTADEHLRLPDARNAWERYEGRVGVWDRFTRRWHVHPPR